MQNSLWIYFTTVLRCIEGVQWVLLLWSIRVNPLERVQLGLTLCFGPLPRVNPRDSVVSSDERATLLFLQPNWFIEALTSV